MNNSRQAQETVAAVYGLWGPLGLKATPSRSYRRPWPAAKLCIGRVPRGFGSNLLTGSIALFIIFV